MCVRACVCVRERQRERERERQTDRQTDRETERDRDRDRDRQTDRQSKTRKKVNKSMIKVSILTKVCVCICPQAQHILTTLVTASTLSNPDTTRGIKMATLYFRPDGQMDSGWSNWLLLSVTCMH